MMSLRQVLAYLDELAQEQSLNRSYLGLERISLLLKQLKNPHRRFPSIHVGGTSGKGSTVTLLRAMLQAQGYRVGSTISPHLEDVRERIQINGRKISKLDLVKILGVVAGANEKVSQQRPDLGRPTYFETLTAAAFLFFAEKKVDLTVVEVGLGGRLDATNVITPEVSVITSIHKDHTKILGSTLGRIAKEKGGIIKPGVPVVLGPMKGAALSVLRRIARQKRSPILQWGKAFHVVSKEPVHRFRERFTWKGGEWELEDVELGLIGPHQIQNAGLALAALRYLAARGWNVSEKAIRRGLVKVQFPGRMEVVGQHPAILLDGAHNPAKINAAIQATRLRFSYERLFVVFSAKIQKDIPSMLRKLLRVAHQVIVTEIPPSSPGGHRLSPSADELARLAHQLQRHPSVLIEPNPRKAVTRARQLSGKNDLILITGSLYLLSCVRPILLQKH